MYLDFKKSLIYQAVKWGRNPIFRFAKFFKSLFFVSAFFCFLLFVFGTVNESFQDAILKKLLGGMILSLSFGFFFFILNLFFETKLQKPRPRYSISQVVSGEQDSNLADFLDFETAKVIFKSLRFAKKKKIEIPTGDALLYFLLNSKVEEMNFVFGRGGLDFKEIKNNLKKEIKELLTLKTKLKEDFEEIIIEAAKVSAKRGKEKIGVGDVLISFSNLHPLFKRFLVLNDFKKEDAENLTSWYERIEEKVAQLKRFWNYENLLKKGSMGRDWAAGYTITLDRFCTDLREYVKATNFREIIGHKKEISEVERILSKEEINNVLLVGEPGTGRKSIIEEISQRAFLGKSSKAINHKRILKLQLSSLIARVPSKEETESILDRSFAEAAKAGNVILVIDEFESFVGETEKAGVTNIAGVLSPYLPLPNFQVIAITTYQGLHQIIEKNPSLLNLFEKVEVSEISEKETLIFLEDFVPFFEKKYKKFITYKALREILTLSSRYLTQLPFPDKAFRLLDEAISFLALQKRDDVLTEKHIKKIVSEKIEIPLEEIEQKEREVLLNLEELIHQRIVNQEEAVKEVSSALRRARAEIKTRMAPIGSFLFLGPTGVGKTETSKALSEIYFGSERRMIRLDMSEFQSVEDIKRLIGSFEQEGFLTTQVRENPFSLLLLDEIEKAHPNVLNLFLQVLDEGWVTDGVGRKVDFKSTIIIATSNAGAELIREDIAQDKKLDIIKEELLDSLFKEGIFRPEFINRFDGVIIFKPLSKENLLSIAHLMLKKLKENLADKGIDFEITQELKEKIVEISYDPTLGAREMKKVIQDKVENILAREILSNKLKRGDSVKVEPETFSLIIS